MNHSHSPHLQNEHALLIAICLNLVFVVLEFMAGWWANSAALSADATHNLSDVLGLVLAWSASLLARRAASARFTYGLRSSSILAALANAMLLFVACGALGWEALQRLQQTPAVASNIVISVATMGIVINGVSAWLLGHSHQHDLNLRAAYWHMVGDAAVSLGVVMTGVVLKLTGWLTAHLVMSGGHPGDAVLADIGAKLKQNFGIQHCTLQIEQQALAGTCSLPATCYLSQPLTH